MEAYRMKSPNKLSADRSSVLQSQESWQWPQIIVMDEPTAMLDPSGRKEVLDTVHELNKRKNHSHFDHTLYGRGNDADRVVVVDGGRIADDGTPREIFRR
ncbi:MAG: hypothetical protein ACLRZ6_02765 [Lachnospiraceae bacterium]